MKCYIDTCTDKAHTFAMLVRRNGKNSIEENTWANGVYALLRKEPKSMKGFSFMPKGEVV